MWYRSPPRPPPGRSTAVSATPAHMAAAAGPAELAGADLEMGRVGWLFGCRRCAAVDELRAGCEQRYATKRCLQLHYLANASSTGPRSGTLRCGAASERGQADSAIDQSIQSGCALSLSPVNMCSLSLKKKKILEENGIRSTVHLGL